MPAMKDKLYQLLGDEAESLLSHQASISQDNLQLPGPDFIDRGFAISDRSPQVLRNLQATFNHGRLEGTGYLSIFPVDQGIEHTAGYSFAPNPDYFDPENIVKLALEGGCNAVATTLGVLGQVSRKYAHKIPFILKLNHNELLTYPNTYDQRMFATVEQAWNLGAVGVGATIYFGSQHARRQIEEVSQAFELAHQKGMFTIAWCYLRNRAFNAKGENLETAADLTGQAIHLASTIQADIVKQKLPTRKEGFTVLQFGKARPEVYQLMSDHPIDLTRYQLINAYAGRIPLINSGGGTTDHDEAALARAAVINKRAGGTGLIAGRKIFSKPFEEGVRLLNLVQDVYASPDVTIA